MMHYSSCRKHHSLLLMLHLQTLSLTYQKSIAIMSEKIIFLRLHWYSIISLLKLFALPVLKTCFRPLNRENLRHHSLRADFSAMLTADCHAACQRKWSMTIKTQLRQVDNLWHTEKCSWNSFKIYSLIIKTQFKSHKREAEVGPWKLLSVQQNLLHLRLQK